VAHFPYLALISSKLHHFLGTLKFMIIELFLTLTSKKLGMGILTQLMVCHSLSCAQVQEFKIELGLDILSIYVILVV